MARKPLAKPQRPASGGRYVRQPDGTLEREQPAPAAPSPAEPQRGAANSQES